MADDEWQYGGEKQPQDDYPKRTTHMGACASQLNYLQS